MQSIAQVKRWPHTFGGHSHEGWLPNNVATPPPTPEVPELLDLRILPEGNGYILEWRTRSGTRQGDTWHSSLDEAKRYAEEYFGVPKDRWI